MATDLKIKDVTELLNVSETTIRRWLAEGKIPAYRINHQYRFSRTEIETWVMNQRLDNRDCAPAQNEQSKFEDLSSQNTDPRFTGGNLQYSLYRAIHKGGILPNISGISKEEVIVSSAKILANSLNLDAEVLSEILLDREKLMPTALNGGIGVPHARDFLLNSHHNVVSVAFLKHPLDYGALDGQPVHTLFFLFAHEDHQHLHLLAKIAHLCSQEKVRQMLKSQPAKKELLAYIKNWESHVKVI